jgi:integrase
MASKYKDDSGVPEPPHDGGAVQNSQNQNAPDAASANLSFLQPAKPIFGRRPTLGDLIGWYAGSILQTKQRRHGSHRQLVSLTVHPVARKVADKLTAAALVHHAQERRGTGTSPLTIAEDFKLIHAVLEAARYEGLIALDLTFFNEARRLCRHDKLIVYRAEVPPRVTDQQLSNLTVYFTGDTQRAELPMNDLMWFAIHSTRRVSEICRLEWQDTKHRDLTGLVRDSLRPHDAAAKHRRFRMTKHAWAIIERQPRLSEFIFPYKAKSIGIAFMRACTAVGTPDLTFDNLRREGMIRLFERGMSISEVREHALCDTPETLHVVKLPQNPTSELRDKR